MKKTTFAKDYQFKNDFPFFKANPKTVFLDSAATSLKPQVMIDAINQYYLNYNVNTHSTDYPLAVTGSKIYESCRDTVATFINCQRTEVVFCPSATMALNQIIYSLGKYLQRDDEIIITHSEHSSLLLPLYRLQTEIGIKLKFLDVGTTGQINFDDLKTKLSVKTKLVAFANMNNSLGTINDPVAIIKLIKSFSVSEAHWPFHEILVLIDGAQAVAHLKTDVTTWNNDFFVFSAHKVFGPTGIGVWWGKSQWLSMLDPLLVGGGMNGRVYDNGTFTQLAPPKRFEAGTVNVAGVFGLQKGLEYLMAIGYERLEKHEKNLKQYLINQLKNKFGNKIIFYNEADIYSSGTLLFNIVGVFAEDVANYLGINQICVRSGNFCAKLIANVIKCASAIRVSFAIYNTKADLDQLIMILEQGFATGGDFLNGFFSEK